ncbi:MAG: GIY-YIG nuclease family protein [Candidatus Solibacter usitatus]|nr:GIY-YIG nuclease family protein [Candidatus Solibacter usitatus]
MTKQQILGEIKRTTAVNGGSPLGKSRFYTETGIKQTDWYGKYWARWGDAVKEAGFVPNQLQVGIEEEAVLLNVANLARDLGRFPVAGDLRLKSRIEKAFPSHTTVLSRLGSKADRIMKVLEYCQTHEGYDDVARICEQARDHHVELITVKDENGENDEAVGTVYLLKSGRNYKIGRSNAVGRREYELAIQLPEKAALVHEIRTDDPVGIEAYWHGRFKPKRKNGEWFELDAQDVKAFRRRKFM